MKWPKFSENKKKILLELFSSSNYWDRRYRRGETSGAGSYNHLAEFKGEFINKFVMEKNIASVIEFGVGDGNQLSYSKFPYYIGYDVSKKAVEMCRRRFDRDSEKKFYHISEWDGESAELVLSLDVIYHLVEDSVYKMYMEKLFEASSKFVIIYSSNTDRNEKKQPIHVKHRKFTEWIDIQKPEWKLIEYIPNRYSVARYGSEGSFADFFVYHNLG